MSALPSVDGGEVVIAPELKISYGPLRYLFVNGVAGITITRVNMKNNPAVRTKIDGICN